MRKEEIVKAGGRLLEEKGRWVVFEHPTMESYINAAAGCRGEWYKSSDSSNEFYGSRTYKEGVEIVRHGLDVAHEAVHLGKFPEFKNQTMDVVEDVVGGEVNIGNFLEGIPENMYDFRIVDNPKFIDVLMSTGEVNRTKVSQMQNRAMGTAWLVDKLESEGYRVRLRTLSNLTDIGGTGWGELTMVTIKDYNEPLAIGQISGACAPAFFRRIGFRHMERFFTRVGYYGHCMGMNDTKAILPLVFPKGEEIILLPTVYMMEQGGTYFALDGQNSAVAWANHYSNHKITI